MIQASNAGYSWKEYSWKECLTCNTTKSVIKFTLGNKELTSTQSIYLCVNCLEDLYSKGKSTQE